MTGEELLQDISMSDLMQMATENPKFRGFLQGYVAEFHLRKLLQLTPGITKVKKIPDASTRHGDFSFVYEGKEFTVEAKSLCWSRTKEDFLNGGVSSIAQIRGSEMIGEKRTGSLSREFYDILAICSFPITGKWDFYFIHSKFIPASSIHEGRMTTSFRVNINSTPCLYDNITQVLAGELNS